MTFVLFIKKITWAALFCNAVHTSSFCSSLPQAWSFYDPQILGYKRVWVNGVEAPRWLSAVGAGGKLFYKEGVIQEPRPLSAAFFNERLPANSLPSLDNSYVGILAISAHIDSLLPPDIRENLPPLAVWLDSEIWFAKKRLPLSAAWTKVGKSHVVIFNDDDGNTLADQPFTFAHEFAHHLQEFLAGERVVGAQVGGARVSPEMFKEAWADLVAHTLLPAEWSHWNLHSEPVDMGERDLDPASHRLSNGYPKWQGSCDLPDLGPAKRRREALASYIYHCLVAGMDPRARLLWLFAHAIQVDEGRKNG